MTRHRTDEQIRIDERLLAELADAIRDYAEECFDQRTYNSQRPEGQYRGYLKTQLEVDE